MQEIQIFLDEDKKIWIFLSSQQISIYMYKAEIRLWNIKDKMTVLTSSTWHAIHKDCHWVAPLNRYLQKLHAIHDISYQFK